MLKDILKNYRMNHCLSIKEMSDKLGVTFTTYWRWENGYPCNYKNAQLISKKLHIKKELIYEK